MPAEATGQTVAAFLRQRWQEASWTDVRNFIQRRHVLVNGNLCLDAGRRLSPREVVRILAHPTAPLPREDDVRVRYLDTDVVVVEKPSGMTSVRHAEERTWSSRRRSIQPTLEDLLPRVIAKKQSAGSGRRTGPARGKLPPVRPVHRLDRETSGLMVFARSVVAHRHLMQQFRRHTTHRRYLAIVQGDVAQQAIETRLVRDRGDGRRGSGNDPESGKRAVTHVRPLEQLEEYTLIECRLETGRTHQIRIHLAELGHPVCGETIYNKPKVGPAIRDESHAPRLALHAAELAFEHPVTRETLSFKMPLPEDLDKFLRRLRKG